jgi:hypothetical protein
VVSPFKIAKGTAAKEYDLKKVRKDRRLQLKPLSTDVASLWLSL